MTPALDIFRRTFAETDSVAAAIEAVYAAGSTVRGVKSTKRRRAEQLEFWFMAACQSVSADPVQIRGTMRHSSRAAVWRWMQSRGCSLSEIGRATNRKHSTVLMGIRKLEART